MSATAKAKAKAAPLKSRPLLTLKPAALVVIVAADAFSVVVFLLLLLLLLLLKAQTPAAKVRFHFRTLSLTSIAGGATKGLAGALQGSGGNCAGGFRVAAQSCVQVSALAAAFFQVEVACEARTLSPSLSLCVSLSLALPRSLTGSLRRTFPLLDFDFSRAREISGISRWFSSGIQSDYLEIFSQSSKLMQDSARSEILSIHSYVRTYVSVCRGLCMCKVHIKANIMQNLPALHKRGRFSCFNTCTRTFHGFSSADCIFMAFSLKFRCMRECVCVCTYSMHVKLTVKLAVFVLYGASQVSV